MPPFFFKRLLLLSVPTLSIFLVACTNPPRLGGVLEPVATIKITPPTAVGHLSVSPDGKYIAAQCYSLKEVCLWNVATREVIRLPHYHGGGVNFSPDGKSLYTTDGIPAHDPSLHIQDANGKLAPNPLQRHYRKRKADEQFTGHRWDLATGKKLKTYYRKSDAEVGVCHMANMRFNADGSRYIAGGYKGLYICDTETGQSLRFIPYTWLDENGYSRERTSGKSYLGSVGLGNIETFTVLPDWKTAVLAVNRYYPAERQGDPVTIETVLLWLDLETGRIVREAAATPKLFGDTGFYIKAIVSDVTGKRVAVATWYSGGWLGAEGNRARATVLDTDTGKVLGAYEDKSAVWSIHFSLDGTILFIASKSFVAWDFARQRVLGSFEPPSQYARYSRFLGASTNGRTLVGGVADTIYVWSLKQ